MKKRIEELLKDKRANKAITALVNELEKQQDLKLPPKLQIILDKVKTTPLEELDIDAKQQEVEAMIESKDLDISEAEIELLEAILSEEDFERLHKDGISLEEFKKLGTAVREKVFGHKYLDSKDKLVFKEIDAHKEMKLLSFFEKKKVRKLASTNQNLAKKAFQKLHQAQINPNEEKIEAALEEVKEINEQNAIVKKELDALAIKYSGLEIEDKTEWEKNLVVAKVIEMANDTYVPPVGKN